MCTIEVGEVDGHAHLCETGTVGRDEIVELRAGGAEKVDAGIGAEAAVSDGEDPA